MVEMYREHRKPKLMKTNSKFLILNYYFRLNKKLSANEFVGKKLIPIRHQNSMIYINDEKHFSNLSQSTMPKSTFCETKCSSLSKRSSIDFEDTITKITPQNSDEKYFIKNQDSEEQLNMKKNLQMKYYRKKNRHECLIFKKIPVDDLVQKINDTFEPSVAAADFTSKDNFVKKVQKIFDENLDDSKKSKIFNFLNLKIVWVQFLWMQKISRRHLEDLTPFEKILFRTFLIRFGYLPKNKEFDFSWEQLRRLQISSNSIVMTEKEMLECVFRQVLKRLMYPYFAKASLRNYNGDMRTVNLRYKENLKFCQDYFKEHIDSTENIKDYLINEGIFKSTKSMIAYLKKISRSTKMCKEIDEFLKSDSRILSNAFENSKSRNANACNIVERYNKEIADKICKRVTNYEIVLNQFDPKIEQKKVLKWMGVMIKDLSLNPRTRIHFSVSQLKESILLFNKYLNKLRYN